MSGIEHTSWPNCGQALEIPKSFWYPADGYKGCRVLEVNWQLLCEGCGGLLQKDSFPSAVEPSRG